MQRLNFTFNVGWPSHTFAEIDGYAEIGPDGIEEIYAEDLADRPVVAISVSGRLEADIKRYLEIARSRDVAVAMAEEIGARRQYDREMATGA